jgi:hypothetical protein
MPEQQALAYIHTASLERPEPDQEWLSRIAAARSHVAGRPRPAVDDASPAALPPKYSGHIEALQQNPAFKEQLAGAASFRLASISLASLRCSQGTLNQAYVARLLKDTPEPSDQEGTLDFCLPAREDSRGTRVTWSTSSASFSTVLVSENLNFRVAGMAQGDDNVTGRKLTAVVYSFGTPQISVSEYKGRYIIVNGHHRAYALLKKGHKTTPCILLSHDDYFQRGPLSHTVIPPETVLSDKPPLLNDFDSPGAITVTRRKSIIVINVHAEAQEVAT